METKRYLPTIYIAKCCGSELVSRWQGEFSRCQCGNAFVDQTLYYVRCSGNIEVHPKAIFIQEIYSQFLDYSERVF